MYLVLAVSLQWLRYRSEEALLTFWEILKVLPEMVKLHKIA